MSNDFWIVVLPIVAVAVLVAIGTARRSRAVRAQRARLIALLQARGFAVRDAGATLSAEGTLDELPLRFALETTAVHSSKRECRATLTLSIGSALPAVTVLSRHALNPRVDVMKPPEGAHEVKTGDAEFDERLATHVVDDTAALLLTDSIRARLKALREPNTVGPVRLLAIGQQIQLRLEVTPDEVGPGDPIYTEARVAALFELLTELAGSRRAIAA